MTKELKWRLIIAIIVALIFILLVIFLPILVVHAESSSQNDFYIRFSFQVDNINAIIETKDPFGLRLSVIELVAAPVLKDGRFCIPIRTLENFGMKIQWNDTNQTVIASSPNNIELQYWIGKTMYLMNGRKRAMDLAPFIKDGRAFIPLRFFAEALGVEEIIWIPETKSVILAWPLGLD